MAFFVWDQKFATDVKEYDTQHQKLFAMINELHDAMKERKGAEVLARLLTNLERYTVTHFTAEEKGMAEVNYPGLAQQQLQHKAFIAKIAEFKLQLTQGKVTLTLDVMTFLKDWLVNHIQKMDVRYGPYFQPTKVR
jgi:hemerythrin